MKQTLRTALVLATCMLAACGKRPDVDTGIGVRPADRWNPKMEKFTSCLEADSYKRSFQDEMPTPQNSEIPVSAIVKQEQVAGVAEGDVLEVDDDNFYFARNGSIEVVDRATLVVRASLTVPKAHTRRLMLRSNRLLYIGEDATGTLLKAYTLETFLPQLEYKVAGRLIDFRRIDDRLVFVTDVARPSNCTDVYRPNLENGSQTVTAVSFVDLGATDVTVKTASLMGSVDFIYMNADDLFLFANSWNMGAHFRRIDLHAAEPAPTQANLIEGTVRDRWSVGEHAGTLFVVTGGVFPSKANGSSNFANKVISFRKNSIGDFAADKESVPFGENEFIQAVRYLGDKAFVVTFRTTDPLFVFDLADPAGPKILSQLESPGFSTVLREMGVGILGGLGFDADSNGSQTGLKFSLFDVSDPFAPRETDRRVWSGRSSFSDATREPKALHLRTDGLRAIFPATLMKDLPNWGTQLEFAGALVIERSGNQVREAARFTHSEWRESLCSSSFLPIGWGPPSSIDIERAVELDGAIYTLSRFGIMRADAATFVTTAQRRFSFLPSLCENESLAWQIID